MSHSRSRSLRPRRPLGLSARGRRLCGADDLPLVAPSYNHSSDERAFMACAGALVLLGGLVLVILAAIGAI